MDSTQNIISFCTGYGGIEIGLKLAGLNVRTVAYVEIEAFACANLVAKIEQGQMDAAPIWTDIKTFDGKPFRNRVHGIIGGYPCQPFSNAGKRAGTDDPRHLWPYILEHIRTIRPLWCFFENVSGHLTLGFDEVFKSLRDLHYKVETGLFTASEVGAPHKRERLFVLAYSEGYRPSIQRDTDNDCERSIQDVTSEKQSSVRSEAKRGDRCIRHELANSDMQPDGQNAGGDGETDSKRIPQRTTGTGAVGNPEHDGLDAGTKPGGIRQTISGPSQGKNGSSEPPRADKSGKLADASSGQSRPAIISEPTETKQPESGDDSGERAELGNSKGTGQQGGIHRQGQEQFGGTSTWPARPGQPQYKWEEPRTIKPGMGRTIDGFKSRVDQLRLLGNGVVPQTAALAWKTLTEILI